MRQLSVLSSETFLVGFMHWFRSRPDIVTRGWILMTAFYHMFEPHNSICILVCFISAWSLSQLYVKIFMPALPVSEWRWWYNTYRGFQLLLDHYSQAVICQQYAELTLISFSVFFFRLLLCTSCKGGIFKIRYSNANPLMWNLCLDLSY